MLILGVATCDMWGRGKALLVRFMRFGVCAIFQLHADLVRFLWRQNPKQNLIWHYMTCMVACYFGVDFAKINPGKSNFGAKDPKKLLGS